MSEDIDELHDVLYFGLEPERRRLRTALVEALASTAPAGLSLQRWVRIVTFQYSDLPLSCGGSLRAYGGRFNLGVDVDEGALSPWPALYLAENFETAFREKFALASDHRVEGLTPQELALEQGISHATVFLNGNLSQLFDLRDAHRLHAVCAVLRKIRMPARARQLRAKLQIPPHGLFMAQTPPQLHRMVCQHNWRQWPVQFGLPGPSQILADLIRQAGYEGILYRSSKGPADCLAVFPDQLAKASFVELADAAHPGVKHRRLDTDSASALSGWAELRPSQAPR